MRKDTESKIVWSSTDRRRKPKETDWFKRIVDGLRADAHKLSPEVKERIRKAAIVVAKAIGGGWPAFRQAATVVKATVVAPQVVGERLSELFAMSYLKMGTDRPKLDHRGDVILAVENLVGPLPATYLYRAFVEELGNVSTVTFPYCLSDEQMAEDGLKLLSWQVDVRNYIVTTHQRRYAESAAFLCEHGISARHPMLISVEECQELRALMFAAKWGEAEGYFEKSWTVREDGSLEIGLHPAGASRIGEISDTVLFQHRVDKVDDVTRERWVAKTEQARTHRKADWYVFSEMRHDSHCEKCFGPVKHNHFTARWYESTFDLHDPQDRRAELFDVDNAKVAVTPRYRTRLFDTQQLHPSDGHPGYCGLVPLGSPTLVENQLQTRRVRARMGWEVRAYERTGPKVYVRVSRNKEILCADGRIWTPEDENGLPEQDFFADPRQVLSWKDKETGRWITIRRWNKLVMQKSMLEFLVPKGPNELGFELYTCVRGRDITSDEAISLLHDKSVIVRRDSTFRRELEGMFLSAVEAMAYSDLEFVHKTKGFGSPEKPVLTRFVGPEGNLVTVRESCKRCASKWGAVPDAVLGNWVEQPHAYVCISCGAEIWRVGVRVFVDRKYFQFVRCLSNRVTHFSADFYGPWVRELLDNTVKAKAVKARAEAALLPDC